MLGEPKIIQTEERPTAVIHAIVPRDQIRTVMGPTLREVFAAIAAQKIDPAGAWYTHHLHVPTDVFDFEVGVPVKTPVAPAGRMKPAVLPAATVARTIYSGPYEGLAGAWGEFMQWIHTQGHTPAADLWECYLAGPESSGNPQDWKTELNRPIVRRA